MVIIRLRHWNGKYYQFDEISPMHSLEMVKIATSCASGEEDVVKKPTIDIIIIKTLFTILSNIQANLLNQHMDRHTGGKWLIHSPQHRKDSHKDWNTPQTHSTLSV